MFTDLKFKMNSRELPKGRDFVYCNRHMKNNVKEFCPLAGSIRFIYVFLCVAEQGFFVLAQHEQFEKY